MLDAFTVKTYVQNGEEKTLWTRIGAAFKCKDNSLLISLNALPIDGKIIVRKRREQNRRR